MAILGCEIVLHGLDFDDVLVSVFIFVVGGDRYRVPCAYQGMRHSDCTAILDGITVDRS